MQALLQLPIIWYGRKKAGRSLGSVPSNKLPSRRPELVGRRFGRLIVCSGEIFRKTKTQKPQLLTRCSSCGEEKLRDYTSVIKSIAGCRRCSHPRQVPKWLERRAIAAQQRCCNPKSKSYRNYGGRGIKFEFDSPLAMGLWVQENLGLHKDMELDRIDNDGPYAPGNLRYSTPRQNMSHTQRKPLATALHLFREKYPKVRYADSTLRGMLGKGMKFEEIAKRWNLPSNKPKGKYGTFSTPDRFIASLYQDF